MQSNYKGLGKKPISGFSLPAWLLVSSFCITDSALAGETVIIDKPVGYDVYGNGDLPYGELSNVANLLDSNNNTVQVVTGGQASEPVYGGYSQTATGTTSSNGNSVIISGGRASNHVFGGYSSSTSGTAITSNNSVIISGGWVGGEVYGGASFSDTGISSATNNSVTILGSPTFGASSILVGGIAGQSVAVGPHPPIFVPIPGMDSFTGNTLNVWNYHGSAVWWVMSFEYYNFIIPNDAVNGSTLLTVTGGVEMDDRNSLGKNTSVSGVNMMGGGTVLQAGDRINLIQAPVLNGALANDGAIIQGTKGVSLNYSFLLVRTPNELVVTVLDVHANPRAKALSEGRVGGLAFVNQGSDLVAGPGMAAARKAGPGLVTFSAFQGSSSRYNTGSHVDVDGFSLMAGLAWNGEARYGKFLLGAFLEAGWGNYDSYNSFGNVASVRGDGDTRYHGGGILGRFDFTNNLYAEASFRMGRVATDFSSSDLHDGIGNMAQYESSATYYGAHLGLGYIWKISEATNLDIFTKYLWTHQNGDSVNVVGDPIRFMGSDSHRWRAGASLSQAFTTKGGLVFTPYISAAYEYEFDGKAEATAYGYSIDAPDLKGSTGIGELGFSFKPSADSGFSLALDARGYVGTRERVAGNFHMKWEF